MGLEQDVCERLQAARHRRPEVALEQRPDDGPGGQLRVLHGLGVEALQEEVRLGIGRPLAPQGAIVVEDGDPSGRRNERHRAARRHTVDEREDRALGVTLAPGRESIQHAAQRPPCIAASIFAITWSTVKLAAFMRGGNCMKVCRNSPTIFCDGMTRYAR